MSEVVMVKDNIKNNSCTNTIRFSWDADAVPGQFVMVWVPGMEEIPLSLSSVKSEKTVTFKIIGKDTERLSQLNAGERMHIRGPFGNGYALDPNDNQKKILLVGGGIGIAPLIPIMKCKSVDAVLAAKDKDEVESYVTTAKNFCMKYWVATDDGSLGFKGNAVDLVKKVLKEAKYDEIIACGPEIMLTFLHQYCNKIHMEHQMSLERYMKCGCGACGCCMIDDKRVCKDGPVFSLAQLKELPPEY